MSPVVFPILAAFIASSRHFSVVLIIFIAALNGCGETINAAGKDVNRMGKGLSTFFFRQQ